MSESSIRFLIHVIEDMYASLGSMRSAIQKICPHASTETQKVVGIPGGLSYSRVCCECRADRGPASDKEAAEYEDSIRKKIREVTGGSI